jgi:hypothetical protein
MAARADGAISVNKFLKSKPDLPVSRNERFEDLP